MISLTNRHHRIIFEIFHHNYIKKELHFVFTSIVSYLVDGKKVNARVRNMKNILEDAIVQLNIFFPLYFDLSVISHIDVRYI